MPRPPSNVTRTDPTRPKTVILVSEHHGEHGIEGVQVSFDDFIDGLAEALRITDLAPCASVDTAYYLFRAAVACAPLGGHDDTPEQAAIRRELIDDAVRDPKNTLPSPSSLTE